MKSRDMFKQGWVAMTLLLALSAWSSPMNFANAAESAAERMYEEANGPAMLLVAIHGDQQLIMGFGKTAQGIKPQADSLIRINSISKLFCAELLAQLANSGQLKLSDSLQTYAPAPHVVPPHAFGEPITLLQLATHTSGLPRVIDNDQETSPDKAARWQWLDHINITDNDGMRATYSNIAYDLLADALENASGLSYETLLHERITSPLNMADTTATPNANQCARFISHIDNGSCASSIANIGSGSLYSTGSDIAKWMKYLLQIDSHKKDASLPPFENTQIPRNTLHEVSGLDLAGEADGIGLGWIHLAASEGRPEILQKTGGGSGFINYMALAPAAHSGIFVTFDKVDIATLQKAATAVNQALVEISFEDVDAKPNH